MNAHSSRLFAIAICAAGVSLTNCSLPKGGDKEVVRVGRARPMNIGIIGEPSYAPWTGHAGSAQGKICPVADGAMADDHWQFNPSFGDPICYKMGADAFSKAVAQGPFYIDVYAPAWYSGCATLVQSHVGPIPMKGGMITTVKVGPR